MNYGISIDQPSALIEQINANIGKAPKLFGTVYKRNMGRVRSRWIAALRVKPPPANRYYPLNYKSDRQRRKVHALRRERGGGAYQRTDALPNSWNVEIETVEDGGSISAINTDPTSIFVYGDLDTTRQPMFDDRIGGIPWLEPNDVNAQYQTEAEDVLFATFETVFDPFAGVPG